MKFLSNESPQNIVPFHCFLQSGCNILGKLVSNKLNVVVVAAATCAFFLFFFPELADSELLLDSISCERRKNIAMC